MTSHPPASRSAKNPGSVIVSKRLSVFPSSYQYKYSKTTYGSAKRRFIFLPRLRSLGLCKKLHKHFFENSLDICENV